LNRSGKNILDELQIRIVAQPPDGPMKPFRAYGLITIAGTRIPKPSGSTAGARHGHKPAPVVHVRKMTVLFHWGPFITGL